MKASTLRPGRTQAETFNRRLWKLPQILQSDRRAQSSRSFGTVRLKLGHRCPKPSTRLKPRLRASESQTGQPTLNPKPQTLNPKPPNP